jgi:membrane protein
MPARPQVSHGLFSAIKTAVLQWIEHKDAKSGAALAYYSIFSIGPLIVVIVTIAGLVFGRESVEGQVTESLKGLLGEKGAGSIKGMLKNAGAPGDGIFAPIIGIATLMFAAVGAVVQLKDALNSVWEVKETKETKETPGTGVWHFART